jgi:hypothetical protein
VKSVLAGVVGVLVATLGVAAWQSRTAAPAYPTSNVPGFVGAAATLPVATAAAQGLPLAVRCAPGQQAVMRQIVVGGQLTAAAECTDAVMPAAYGASLVQPVSSDIVQWQQPRVVPASYTVRESAPRRVVREERKRNWGKTALVIGGSAGAGAGVGAIAGGKKGALIGAAIGGGAASLFEALKK